MGKNIAIGIVVTYLCVAGYMLFFVRSKATDPTVRRSRNRVRTLLVGIFTCVLIVISYFMFFFRTEGKELTGKELMALTEEWKDPRSVQWHYVGTYEEYDYFHHRDLGIVMGYVVKEGEIEIDQRFEATSDETKWTLMPWGPHKNTELEPVTGGNSDRSAASLPQ